MMENSPSLHRILVVDDEEIITKSLSRLLQYYGYHVVTANNGLECLQILSAQHFDLVILDIIMPGMSGIDVLQKIKEKHKDAEVIMITGYADKEKAISAFRLNAYDLIEKPYGAEEILNTIAHCLKQMELKREIGEKSRELKESEEQYRSIFNEARDGIVLIDKETGNIFNCNPEFERQTGRRLEHLKKMKIWEVMPSEIVEVAKKTFFEIKEKRTNGFGELEFQKPDGNIIPIEFVNKGVEIRGKQFIQSITRNIIKRKQAEESLREHDRQQKAILNNIPDIAWLKDKESRFIAVNEPFGNACGMTPEDLVGKTDLDIWPKDLAERYRADDRGVMETSRRKLFEEPLVDKDGNKTWIETIKTPIYNGKGDVIGTTGIARDITERKQAEEALRRVAIENARLFESVKQQREQLLALTIRLAESEAAERQQLARELHDQVGQNLTALGINLNIVRTQMPQEALAQICSRLDDSLSLVEQTTERIRNVMADLKPPVLDDYGLVAALRWYGAQFSSRTGIPVDVQGEEPLPRLTPHVENTMFRITQEALTNVAKYSQAAKVTVIVEAEKKTVLLIIMDNGIGFDPTQLNKPNKASGWGLLTMSERAETIGGYFRIDSRPGQGTRIVVEVAR
jgi:two-component system sensor histidine kinase UhpB